MPEGEEILVAALALVSSVDKANALPSCKSWQCARGIADQDPRVILLECRGGFGALACGQIGLATHIDG